MEKKLNWWNDPLFVGLSSLCLVVIICFLIIGITNVDFTKYKSSESSNPTIEKKTSECNFWYNRGVKDWTPVLDCRIFWREFYEGYFPIENRVCFCDGFNSVR